MRLHEPDRPIGAPRRRGGASPVAEAEAGFRAEDRDRAGLCGGLDGADDHAWEAPFAAQGPGEALKSEA